MVTSVNTLCANLGYLLHDERRAAQLGLSLPQQPTNTEADQPEFLAAQRHVSELTKPVEKSTQLIPAQIVEINKWFFLF